MPDQYESIKESLRKQHPDWSEDELKEHASKIFIARGKGGDRSTRAKALHSDKPARRKPKVSYPSPKS